MQTPKTTQDNNRNQDRDNMLVQNKHQGIFNAYMYNFLKSCLSCICILEVNLHIFIDTPLPCMHLSVCGPNFEFKCTVDEE